MKTVVNQYIESYLRKEKFYSDLAKVISVDDSTRKATVELLNSDLNVKSRMQASISLTNGIYIKPKVNSYVVVNWINKNLSFIALYSEIDKIKINNSDTDLKTILNDLITAIKAITVPTPAGTSGVPLNIADFTNINTEINKLFE